jgi:hypothetical protein
MLKDLNFYFVEQQKSKKKGGSDGNASGEYHPTVTPAKPFNPVKDSEVIRKAVGKSMMYS